MSKIGDIFYNLGHICYRVEKRLAKVRSRILMNPHYDFDSAEFAFAFRCIAMWQLFLYDLGFQIHSLAIFFYERSKNEIQ